MLLIPCPWCGPRAQTEFSYGGDATARRPADPDEVSREAWLDHVFLRDNPRGPHLEWWQHSAGCRRWLRVHRDTLTHEVLGSAPPGEPLAGAGP
jgi:heterotetrameric sarcosine oxidase delta subunit